MRAGCAESNGKVGWLANLIPRRFGSRDVWWISVAIRSKLHTRRQSRPGLRVRGDLHRLAAGRLAQHVTLAGLEPGQGQLAGRTGVRRQRLAVDGERVARTIR